jgi:hypothetical protein
MSPLHLLIILLVLVMIFPVVRIIRRTGHSGWWCLLLFVPVLNWVALWIFAYAKWPAVDKT